MNNIPDSKHREIKVHIKPRDKTVTIRVRESVSVETLIEKLRVDFSLPSGDYVLCPQGNDTPLDAQRTFGQRDVVEYAQFDLHASKRKSGVAPELIKRQERISIPTHAIARISLDNGREIRLEWYPAILGRHHENERENLLLAVDLNYLPNATAISRHHACIIYTGGQYTLEHLSPNGKTYLDGVALEHQTAYPLRRGSKIRIGNSITLRFMLADE